MALSVNTKSSKDEASFWKFRSEVTQQIDDLQRHYTATLQHLRAENDKLKEQLKSAHSLQSLSQPPLSPHVPEPISKSLRQPGTNSTSMSSCPWTPRTARKYEQLVNTPRFTAASEPKPQPYPNAIDEALPLMNTPRFAAPAEPKPQPYPNVLDDAIEEVWEDTSPAVSRWARFFTWLCHQAGQPKKVKEETSQAHAHELRPIWTAVTHKTKPKPQPRMDVSTSLGKQSMQDSVSLGKVQESLGKESMMSTPTVMGSKALSKSKLQQFVRHPDSKWTLIHSLLCSVLIAVDVVVFPFSMAFLRGPTDVLSIMNTFTTVFWTLDIPFSFFQGYHTHGIIEMRPPKVALEYLSHWFILDSVIVVLDWTFYFLSSDSADGSASGETGILRMGKPIKLIRFLRTARILRLMKTPQLMHQFLDHAAPEEWMLVIMKLFCLMMLVLLVCHYIACAWCTIGSSSDKMSWIEVQGLQDDSIFTIYTTSLHWAITQFTPSTNNIAPANAYERVFAIFVVLFALVMFSNFISSLTNMTAQLRRLHSARSTEESQIRDFFNSKHVPVELGHRIWHFYRKHYRLRHKVPSSSEIAFFDLMPMSLRVQLHWQIYLPTLVTHPVLDRAACLDPSTMMWLCNAGMEERVVSVGQELFMEGQTATHMIAMVAGKLQYECDFYVLPVEIEFPALISEAALWSKWCHCGRLSGAFSVHCEVLIMAIAQMETCIAKHATDMLMRFLRKYACRFTQIQSDAFERLWQSAAETKPRLSGSSSASYCDFTATEFTKSDLITDVTNEEMLVEIVQLAEDRHSLTGMDAYSPQKRGTKKGSERRKVSVDSTSSMTTSFVQIAQWAGKAGRLLRARKAGGD